MIQSRRGVSLIEMLIAMVVSAGVGAAMMSLLAGSTRFEERAEAQRAARLVSRSAVNVIVADLRMVDPSWGVEAATTTSITVKTPYALGIVCDTGTTAAPTLTLMFLPVDSLEYSTPGYSGIAWRSTGGLFTAVAGGTLATLTTAQGQSKCPTANFPAITAPASAPNQKSIYASVTPTSRTGAPINSVVVLYRRTRFYFANSTQTGLTTRTALWRNHLDAASGAGDATELVAPFDATAAFQFFVSGSSAASSTIPSPLSTMRGLLLFLPGESENTARTRSTPEESDLTTSVYFFNSSS
ncbi:MAG TPA: type II secretion system protein [Gemmatimonadales bacterium]|jgi:prepilin-type N-terminal cleavage/methylation domain-containing protein